MADRQIASVTSLVPRLPVAGWRSCLTIDPALAGEQFLAREGVERV